MCHLPESAGMHTLGVNFAWKMAALLYVRAPNRWNDKQNTTPAMIHEDTSCNRIADGRATEGRDREPTHSGEVVNLYA